MRKKLFHHDVLSHRQIAFLIGMSPPLLCHIHKNKVEHINIEYLINLAKIASVSLDDLIESINEFKVADITPLEDKEFINFVFELKAFFV